MKPEGADTNTGQADSGDRSSLLRKRALRRLSREQHAAYSALYEQVQSESAGLSRHLARERARTLLRYQFPERYLELYGLERCAGNSDVPPGIRSKSWQRATARLADLHQAAYQPRYEEFMAQGMPPAKAYDRAIAAVRERYADLFARLLAEEYQLWMAVSRAAGSQASRNDRALTIGIGGDVYEIDITQDNLRDLHALLSSARVSGVRRLPGRPR